MKNAALFAAVWTALVLSGPAFAQNPGHTGHDTAAETTGAVSAKAVVHKVDPAKRLINVTHEPIPALRWPPMTMDLPVTKTIDLSKIREGDTVTITLKQGVDKAFRVVAVDVAK